VGSLRVSVAKVAVYFKRFYVFCLVGVKFGSLILAHLSHYQSPAKLSSSVWRNMENRPRSA